MDVILIVDNCAHEIWRGTSIDSLRKKYHADLIAKMVEQPAGTVNEGDVWDADGKRFAAPQG